MAEIPVKIRDLPAAASVDDAADVLPIAMQDLVTRKVAVQQLHPTYTNSNPTVTTVGGITAGTVLPANTTFAQFLDAALYPFVAPVFTLFAISGVVGIYEVGDKITGSRIFSWSFSDIGLITDNTIDITDNIMMYNIAVNISKTSPFVFDFSNLPSGGASLTIAGAYSWTISADYEHPTSGTTTITRNAATSFRYPKFSGAAATQTLNNTEILALTKALSTTGLGTYAFPGNGYFHLYVADTLPQPTIFKDQATGFSVDVINDGIISVTTDFGIVKNYYHYVSANYLVSSFNVVAT